MQKIFIVKPKTLSASDKQKLTKHGHLVIEHEFPQEVRIITPVSEIDGNLILMSAMSAMNTTFPKDKFASEISRRILEKDTTG